MGATLPILSKWAVQQDTTLGVTIGRLYALNTFGAVIGTALSGFFLIPLLGVNRTLGIALAVNLLVALSIFWLIRHYPAPPTPQRLPSFAEKEPGQSKTTPFSPMPRGVIWSVVLGISLSGFISMIYEVAWSRTLSLLVDSSVYGFTIMLTTFLVGIALGSYVFSYKVDSLRFQGFVWAWLQIGIGVFAFLSLLFFQELPYWYLLLYRSLGQSINFLLAGKFILAFFIMLAPTLFMGAIFPLTIKIYASNINRVSRLVGNIYTINTLGCILGSFAGGFFLIPLWGIRNTLLLGIGLNLLLGLFLLLITPAPRPGLKWVFSPAVLLLTGIILWFPPAWKAPLMVSGVYIYAQYFDKTSRRDLLKMYEPKNDPLLFYKEGHTCTISVHKSRRTGAVYMKSNGKVEASSRGDVPTQVLGVRLPCCWPLDWKKSWWWAWARSDPWVRLSPFRLKKYSGGTGEGGH